MINIYENTNGKKEDWIMKTMKKVATLLLAVCLTVPCFSMLTHAANRIMFEDPSTAVGQTLQLKGVVELNNNIEDRTVVMTYDTSMLKFQRGDNVTETSPGQLTYQATGAVGGNRAEFLMYFDVLKEGTTKVEVTSQKIYNTSDALIRCDQGNSTITIAAGETPTVPIENPTTENPSTGETAVQVNGTSYIFSDAFAEGDIPQGFEESVIEYDGASHKVVVQESSGLTLGYLVDAEGAGKFFRYISDNATFVPFEQIAISDSTTITLLSDVEEIVLPESYKATTVSVNGVDFPAWQEPEKTELCVLYAMNNRGEKSLYQFDTEEGTYQRFEAPQVTEEKEDTSFIGRLSSVLENHLDYVILWTGLGLILFIIIIVVLSVKLYNRNAELDELYDEYGIDLEEEEFSELAGSKEEDDIFVRIDDETEDDVILEEESVEKEPVEETAAYEEISKKDSEKEPAETVEKDMQASAKESEADTSEVETSTTPEKDEIAQIAREIGTESKGADGEFLDEDDNLDFEMDFLDLDD